MCFVVRRDIPDFELRDRSAGAWYKGRLVAHFIMQIQELKKVYDQKVVIEDFPIVPTFFDRYAYVTSDKIKKLPSVAGSPIVSKIELNG